MAVRSALQLQLATNIMHSWGAIGISSHEAGTQGNPLSMICNGIGNLPLIRMVKSEFLAQNSNGLQMMDELADILQTV